MFPLVPQSYDNPILIPEDGLKIDPKYFQIAILAICPIIAFVAIAIPAIFILGGLSFIVLKIWNYFDPKPWIPYTPEQLCQTTQHTKPKD